MKERPILMSAPMVRAILDGTKTQTRRSVKGVQRNNCMTLRKATKTRAGLETHVMDAPSHGLCPYGQPGDRLWVKETFIDDHKNFPGAPIRYVYRADHPEGILGPGWTPSIFCTRAASRITLEVVSVRVERLQDISEADAKAEGIESSQIVSGRKREPMMWRDYSQGRRDPFEDFSSPVDSYRTLWESINGAGSWAANPWVWAVEFRRVAP